MNLLGSSRPAAVFGAVIAVVVLALNCVLCTRALANVSNECLYRIAPAITYRNAATAIVRIRLASRVKASAKYVNPAVVFRRLSETVRNHRCSYTVSSATAAIGGCTGLETMAIYGTLSSAMAAAHPKTTLPVFVREPSHGPLAELVSRQIAEVRLLALTFGNSLKLSHFVTSMKGCEWLEPASVSSACSGSFHFTADATLAKALTV